jgi:Putative Actinobacterial Holin-X, holin superfamily III
MAISGRASGKGSLRDRSLPELIGNLAEETSTLVRQEVHLAKAELLEKLELMRQDAARRGRLAGLGSAFAAAAAVVGVISVGLIATLLVALFAIAMPVSAAVGIVLALFLLVTGVLAYIGIERLRSAAATPRNDVWRPVPEQTIETLKEDIQWAKHPTRSASTSSRHARA